MAFFAEVLLGPAVRALHEIDLGLAGRAGAAAANDEAVVGPFPEEGERPGDQEPWDQDKVDYGKEGADEGATPANEACLDPANDPVLCREDPNLDRPRGLLVIAIAEYDLFFEDFRHAP